MAEPAGQTRERIRDGVRESTRTRPAPLLRTVVGDVLRRTRQRQGRTLAEVAQASRVSMPYLSEVERGRKEASSEVLAAVCAGLRITLSDLLTEVRRELHNRSTPQVSVAPVIPLAAYRARRRSGGRRGLEARHGRYRRAGRSGIRHDRAGHHRADLRLGGVAVRLDGPDLRLVGTDRSHRGVVVELRPAA
ncbi:MAG TPA: helix-turn-helix transcriptional regulator [Natronosporangium sp.]